MCERWHHQWIMAHLLCLSVCLERVHRGQQPKNFWSTSSSHDTQRRRPTWQSWSTATAAGSPRVTARNPAPMTQICEFSEDTVSYRILSTGSHVGDNDPINSSILAKISGWYKFMRCWTGGNFCWRHKQFLWKAGLLILIWSQWKLTAFFSTRFSQGWRQWRRHVSDVDLPHS